MSLALSRALFKVRAVAGLVGRPAEGATQPLGWCEEERIAFEHQGPQHTEPVIRSNSDDGRPNIEAARLKHRRRKEYDALKAWACAGQAALIVIPDISVRGYGYARSRQVVETIAWAVRTSLPPARLGASFEAAVDSLYVLDRAGWQQLIEPIFAGSTRVLRLRQLADSKGGRVIAITDENTAVFECVQGHQWEAQIYNVLAGTWCPIEGVGLRARSRRLTISALRARLDSCAWQ